MEKLYLYILTPSTVPNVILIVIESNTLDSASLFSIVFEDKGSLFFTIK